MKDGKTLPVVKELKSCKHGKSKQKKPHRCPYQSDLYGDDSKSCTCCTACEQECALDI